MAADEKTRGKMLRIIVYFSAIFLDNGGPDKWHAVLSGQESSIKILEKMTEVTNHANIYYFGQEQDYIKSQSVLGA